MHFFTRHPGLRRATAALLAFLCVAGPLSPLAALADGAAVNRRIYIANDDHTDYFWTASDVQYRQAFQTMLDYYMNQMEATRNAAWDHRGRYNADCSLWVWEYEHARPAADFNRLVGHLRDSSLTMPLNTCVELYGGMSAEALLRNMYYPGRLERRYNLQFPLVVAMENQTLPGGVASLWAGSGAKYGWKGICSCASQIDAGQRPRDIYNFRGPDAQSMVMKWNRFEGGNFLGSYSEARKPTYATLYMDGNPGYTPYWKWDVSGAFGYGEDDFQTMVDSFVNVSNYLSTPSRRVIVSNEIDFFKDFLANHAAEIPTFGGSFGNEWDLYIASMGEVSADFKRHVESLRSGEALAAIASLYVPSFMVGRDSLRDKAFKACGMYYEHDWTANGIFDRSVRAQFQRNMLRDLSTYVDSLNSNGLKTVCGLVSQGSGVERHAVFNPLSWTRTDFADLAVSRAAPFHIADLYTGSDVPFQNVVVNGIARVRILASGIPSVGYKVYEVRPGAGQIFSSNVTVALPTFANSYYSITVGAHGNITSLLDKKDANRQLVNTGASGSLFDLGTGSGTVYVENTGPVSTTLRVIAGGSPAHSARVTLYSSIDRVDFEGRINQNFGTNVSYVSNFSLPGASMRHEEVGEIARVARAAQGGDYADQNARTDYLTMNHFVDMSQVARGVTLSNWDSQFFQSGASTYTYLDSTPTIRAVVGMQVDGPGLGITNQGGDTLFLNRYALQTHGAYDQPAAMRMALEHQNPLVAGRITGTGTSPLPANYWSLLSLSSPDILLWSLKPSEEGITNGLIARVWNMAEGPRAMSLSLPSRGISAAKRTTHIETDIATLPVVSGAVQDSAYRQQMRTYRLYTATQALEVPDSRGSGPQLNVSPNPFRPGERISVRFSLGSAARVRVTVHDAQGARVATLASGTLQPGDHVMAWDGRRGGGTAAAGVYFVRLDTPAGSSVKKLVLLK